MLWVGRTIGVFVALAAVMALAGCSAVSCDGDEEAEVDNGTAESSGMGEVLVLSAYSPADSDVSLAFSGPVYVVGEVALRTSRGNLPPLGSLPAFSDEAETELSFDGSELSGEVEVSGFAGEGGVFDMDGDELPADLDEPLTLSLWAEPSESVAASDVVAEETPVPTATPLPAKRITQLAPVLPTPAAADLNDRVEDALDGAGWFADLAEIVSVSLEGDAGDTRSWFIFGFDEAVTAPRPEEVFLMIHSPADVPDTHGWTEDKLPLITPLDTLEEGVSELGFGPVKSEGAFAVAIEGVIEDMAGRKALLGFAPVRFTATRSVGGPIEEGLTGCVAVLERREVSGVIVRLVRQEEPDALDDVDRVVWGRLIADEFGMDERMLLEAFARSQPSFDPDLAEARECRALWSQPVASENSEKRNASYALGCLSPLGSADPTAPWSARGDALELAGRRYDGLDVAERMELRGVLDAGDGADSCRRWYPQLFYGRWIPLEGHDEQ